MGIFAGQHGAVVVGLLSNGEQTFPTCVFGAFHIVVLDTGVEILALDTGVETTDDIDGRWVFAVGPLCPFVMDEACGVVFLDPCACGGKVGAPSRLVAQ